MEYIVSQGLALPGIEVVVLVRRCFGDRGPVKVEFISDTVKVDVLKAKRALKDKPQYNNLYIRSAKSHEERLIDRTLKLLWTTFKSQMCLGLLVVGDLCHVIEMLMGHMKDMTIEEEDVAMGEVEEDTWLMM